MILPLYRGLSPLGVGRAPAAAAGWWLAGGVSPSNAVAVYQPKGAASQAASYVNLANPGTYDAQVVAAPDWSAATGWSFNSSDRLNTGVMAEQTWSMIVRYSGSTVDYNRCIGVDGTFMLSLREGGATNVRYWFGTTGRSVTVADASAGVMALVGAPLDARCYWNGADVGGIYNSFVGQVGPLLIGVDTNRNFVIQAMAIYNVQLTAAMAAAISAAMAAL